MQDLDPSITGPPGGQGDNGDLVPLAVVHPEVEVVVLEERDLRDRRRVVVDPPGGRQDTAMGVGGERHARVADRIGPRGDARGIHDRGIEELADTQIGNGVRERRVQSTGVEPELIDLGRIGAELRAPLDPRHVANDEPPVVILQPEPSTMMVLVVRGAVEERGDPLGHRVHPRPGADVIGGVGTRRMIGDVPGPTVVLVLRMRRIGIAHAATLRHGLGARPREVPSVGASERSGRADLLGAAGRRAHPLHQRAEPAREVVLGGGHGAATRGVLERHGYLELIRTGAVRGRDGGLAERVGLLHHPGERLRVVRRKRPGIDRRDGDQSGHASPANDGHLHGDHLLAGGMRRNPARGPPPPSTPAEPRRIPRRNRGRALPRRPPWPQRRRGSRNRSAGPS